eukprot:6421400-Prymnesium_polylepis.1
MPHKSSTGASSRTTIALQGGITGKSSQSLPTLDSEARAASKPAPQRAATFGVMWPVALSFWSCVSAAEPASTL